MSQIAVLKMEALSGLWEGKVLPFCVRLCGEGTVELLRARTCSLGDTQMWSTLLDGVESATPFECSLGAPLPDTPLSFPRVLTNPPDFR